MHTLTPLQEELPTVLKIYERRDDFDENLSLLEAGLSWNEHMELSDTFLELSPLH